MKLCGSVVILSRTNLDATRGAIMLVWRGVGPVVIVVGIVASLIINIITSKVFDQNNYFQDHLWPKILALIITGLCCWFFGRYLHSRPPQRTINNKGEEVLIKPVHDFMMIKVEYWGVICFLLAVFVLVVNLAS